MNESLVDAVRNIIRTKKSLASSLYLLSRERHQKKQKKLLNSSLNENILVKAIKLPSNQIFSVKHL